ncbi:hypothetical protein [Pseudarthrobacter sp. NKDBFgelt]|uniref:hypothetical protein n=1 Tax=Pseudarthrobacter sp. NKDBFgelt TaxID=3384443 RepID=UPI0038D444A1
MKDSQNPESTGARILADLRHLVKNLPPVPPIPLNGGARKDLSAAHARGMTWGWMMRVLRTSEAIAAMERVGYAVEASPLRRSAIEHVIRLQWARTVDPSSLVELALKYRAWSLEKVKNAASKGSPLPEGALELIEELAGEADPEHPGSYKDLTSLMHDVPDYMILYQGWLTETQESHPTLTSAAPYFAVSDDWTSTDLRTRPRPPQIFPVELPTLTLLAVEAFVEIVGIADQVAAPLAEIRARIEQLGAERHVAPESED